MENGILSLLVLTFVGLVGWRIISRVLLGIDMKTPDDPDALDKLIEVTETAMNRYLESGNHFMVMKMRKRLIELRETRDRRLNVASS